MSMTFFQPHVPPLPSTLELSGKVALVTGANRTLGYAVSQNLIRHGISKLVMAVRSLKAGEAARQTLLEQATAKGQTSLPEIIVRTVDMASPKSVISLVDGLNAEGVTLNIAILNAGISNLHYSVSEETGFESIFQVNYVSTALLAVLLLPLLSSNDPSKPSQLCVVGSEAYNLGTYNKKKTPDSIFTEINDPANFSASHYSDSKYFVYLFLRRLAAHRPISKFNVQIVCTCPGQVMTDLGRSMPWYFKWIMVLIAAMRARTIEQGSNVITYAGTGLAGDEAHGEMFRNMIVEPPLACATSEEGVKMTDQLWKETVQYFESVKPGMAKEVGIPL